MARLARRICPAGEQPPVPLLQRGEAEPGEQLLGALLIVLHAPGLHGKGDVRPDGVLDEHLLRILIHQGNLPGEVLCLFPVDALPV